MVRSVWWPPDLDAVCAVRGQAAHSSRLHGYGSGEIVAVGEAYDTMAAGMEGCGAVQRAADGADVVEADRCQQVAAWLSGWAWRPVWRPAWDLRLPCRRGVPLPPLARIYRGSC